MLKLFETGIKIPIHDNKLIEEFIGVQRDVDQFSVAHMVMPKKWKEPSHGTKFDELVIVISGELTLDCGGTKHRIHKNQVGWLTPSDSVIFCNESENECEYWSICFPAFHPDRVFTN
jgi:probable rRNA maturation factor